MLVGLDELLAKGSSRLEVVRDERERRGHGRVGVDRRCEWMQTTSRTVKDSWVTYL